MCLHRRLAWLSPALLAAACTPVLNWRQVSLPPTTATLLLPCKPDRTTRSVPLGGLPTELAVAGCEAGGATFALMGTVLPAGRAADELLAGWQQASLAHMQASGTLQRQPFTPRGASALPHAERLQAQGRAPNGRPVVAHAAWAARALPGGGAELLHAVVYAERPQPAAAAAFFEVIQW